MLEVASDLFVQKWLCLWMLSPLPQVADIDARSSSAINPRRSSSTQNKRLLDFWWQILFLTEWPAPTSFWHLYEGLSHQSPVTPQAALAAAIACGDGGLLSIRAHRS
ncbi:MAG: hypothetical protein ED554_05675 [Synechococcus sp. YX04-3]|nr:MAG: hypothetical protein ED554_05675 [Synechococcus sp. YX04-3]